MPHCAEEGCDGLVKPNIVFFGEQLPSAFYKSLPLVETADLALVIGTSLAVQPFSILPDRVPEDCPRVLFNMEQVGSLGTRVDDVLQLGDCDANVCTLADHLGWLDELNALWRETVGEEEAERQLARIRQVKKKVIEELKEDMEELTKAMGQAGLESDEEDSQGEGSGADSSPRSGEEGVGVSSAEHEDTTSSGAAVAKPEDAQPEHHDTTAPNDAEAAEKQQEVDVAHAGEHHKAAGTAEPDTSDLKIPANAEAFLAPVSAPAFHPKAEAKVEPAKVEPAKVEPANEDASKGPHESSNKPSLL